MKYPKFNYVRSFRQRHALTENELALLLNQQNRTAISLIETGDRAPTLEGAFALQVIFGQAPKELFAELYEHVEDGVMRRARLLYEQLEGEADQRSKTKIALIEEMARRRDPNEIEA